MFKLYSDLTQIVQHKTFFDRDWKELWDIYFNISDIFKNVCEKNEQTSKIFFNYFRLALNENNVKEWDGVNDEISHSMSNIKKSENEEGSKIN